MNMSFPIQPDPDVDFYVLWSNVVDAAVGWGTREEVAEMMLEDRIESAKREIENSLTLSRHPRRTQKLTVMEGPGGPGEIEADLLMSYVLLLDAGSEDAAAALVTPLKDW